MIARTMSSSPSSQRGADHLVQSLATAGVSRLFTLSGNQVMSVFDATIGTDIELIHVRHEAAAVLIPELQAHAAQALDQGQPLCPVEAGMVAHDCREAIERDPAVEVMHMVQPDIGRQPVKWRRKIIVRAAVQRRLVQLPIRTVVPGRVLELMLDVEQPHPDRRRQNSGGQVDEEHGLHPDEGAEEEEQDRQRKVGPHGAPPQVPASIARPRNAVLHPEEQRREDPQHHQAEVLGDVAEHRLEGDAQEMLDAREPEVYRGCLESNRATVQDRPVDLSTRARHNQRHCTRHR